MPDHAICLFRILYDGPRIPILPPDNRSMTPPTAVRHFRTSGTGLLAMWIVPLLPTTM